MKKIVTKVASLALFAFALVACGGQSDGTDPRIRDVYESYRQNAESNGETPLSYEEWLETIKGDKGEPGKNGEDGADGKSAYELYLESHPDYQGDEKQWIDDLVNGRLVTQNYGTPAELISNDADLKAVWHVGDGAREVNINVDPTINVLEALNKGKLTIESDNPAIVFACNKMVYPQGVGTATITVSYNPNGVVKLGEGVAVSQLASNKVDTIDLVVMEPEKEPEYVAGKTLGDLMAIPQSDLVADGKNFRSKEAYVMKVKVDCVGNKADGTAEADKFGNMYVTDEEGNNKTQVYGSSSNLSALVYDERIKAYRFLQQHDWLTNAGTKDIKKGDILDVIAVRTDYNKTKEISFVIWGINGVSISQGPLQREITSETTITFWHNMNDNNLAELTKIKTAFEKENPLVKVELAKQSGGWTDILSKTEEGIPADNYPDIFYGYPDSVQTLMNYGVVLDMDAIINNKIYGWTQAERDDVVSDYLKEGQSYSVRGTYSLPLSKSTEAMYYNPKLIGLDLSKVDATINAGKPLTADYINNLTWDELFDKLCPALKQYNDGLAADSKLYTPNADGKSGIVGYDSDGNLFITLAEQYGYGYTSVDQTTGAGKLDFINDGMKGLMKKFNKAVKDGYFCTGGTCGQGYTNSYATGGNALFAIGSTAVLSHQYTSTYTCNIARIPHAPGKDPKVINQGPSVAFLDHKNPQRALASWLFYKYWTNTANATAWAITTSYLPIRKSVFTSDAWTAYLGTANPDQETKMRITQSEYVQEVSSELYSSPVFKGSAEARVQVEALTVRSLSENDLTDSKLDELFETAYRNALKRM